MVRDHKERQMLNRSGVDGEIIKHSTHLTLKQLQNSTFKGAAMFNEIELSLYNYKKPADQRLHHFNVLHEKFISFSRAVCFEPAKFLLHSSFKKKIKQLVEGGFFVHWLDRYKSHGSLVEKISEENKVILTWDHLHVGFTIWLAWLLIASMAFIAEQIKFYFLNFYRSMFQRD